MFIRAKNKRLDGQWRRGMRYSFQIVECKRIEGKPRQKVIKHIGSITVFDPDKECPKPHIYPSHRKRLWEEFDAVVTELNPSEELIQKLTHELASSGFIRPSAEEIKQLEIQEQQLMNNLRSLGAIRK